MTKTRSAGTTTLYCHDCRERGTASHSAPADTYPDGEVYYCEQCGSLIVCDGCGTEWTDSHECGA